MDDNLDDFIKLAYQRGKVKDAKEAFEEYPAENEWHKGEDDFFVNESSEKYTIYQVGDIVYVKNFMYKNNKKGHNHLFVIISKDNLVVPIEYFGMLISSQLSKLKYKENKLINKNNTNKLDKDSLVKTDVIYKIEPDQILFKIGRVEKENIETYKHSFIENN